MRAAEAAQQAVELAKSRRRLVEAEDADNRCVLAVLAFLRA